ncbi:MAG: RNA polymerase factor sigma-54 [Mycoplasmataceae bacterium]|nr:RNA polymerase factor sigma-54 [Mycoplasmataceae bacterium]
MQQRLAVGLEQRQNMKFTPQLRQTVALLALPLADLQLQVQQALEKYPALEIKTEQETLSLEHIIEGETRGEQNIFDDNPEYNSFDTFKVSKSYNKDYSDQKQGFIEELLSREETLHEHLRWQLGVQPLSDNEIALGEIIIENLDENGFLLEPFESFIQKDNLKILPKIINIIQQFDPPGTVVSNVTESLIVQSEIRGDAPEKFSEILNNSFDEIQKNHISKISKIYQIEEEEVNELIRYLTILTPFPGALFSKERPDYIMPELSIKRDGKDFIVKVNNEEIPELQISAELVTFKEAPNSDINVIKFVETQIVDANNFIAALNYRFTTLEKVARELLELQNDFFRYGPKHLKPLKLKELASRIDVHESTISRITTSKYIHTDWGIFSLKLFFSSGTSKTNDLSAISRNSIKEIIKEIITQNKTNKKLSDQKISDFLQEKDISIARRTVAKYRKELDIASSFDRGII